MHTVRSKITWTYVLLVLLTILLIGWLTDYQIERFQENQVFAELRSHLSAVASVTQFSSSPAQTRSLLHDIARRSGFRITLIDSAGVVLFESDIPDSLLGTIENHRSRPEILEATRTGRGTATRYSATLATTMAYAAEDLGPITPAPKGIPGARFARTAMPMTSIEQMRTRLRTIVIVSALLTLVIVGGVSIFVSRQISRPIEEMSRVMEQARDGDYSMGVRSWTNDEIGTLARSINALIERLRDDEERLRRLETMRSQFIANVSHELRTPIFALRGFLETLLDGVPDGETQKRFLERAEAQAERLDLLLSDLIDISRIESGELKPSLRFFELQNFLADVLEEMSHRAASKHQLLQGDWPQSPISIMGDKSLLRLVFRNLIDNALKYSPDGSTITVQALRRDASVEFAVIDDGPGIPPEHLPRIFERFYRVDSNRSRDLGGTGLGLAIVKHIVEAHGSSINVMSKIGSGTSFSFFLRSDQ